VTNCFHRIEENVG